MTDVNNKAAADLFDEIAEKFTALSSLFRTSGGSSGTTKNDGKVAGSSKPAKSSPKVEKGDEDEVDEDTLREKLKELADAKGVDRMVEALAVAGAGSLKEVDESQYADVFAEAQRLIDLEDEDAPAPKKVAAKKTAKKKGPSLEDVQAAAQALIDADKPAYLKLAKKLGKPSEMEEPDYTKAIAAYEEAMPAEGNEEEDLL